MLPFPHVVNFFPHKFTRLSAWRLPLPGILARTFQSLFLRHYDLLSRLPRTEFRQSVQTSQSMKGRKRHGYKPCKCLGYGGLCSVLTLR